MNVGANDSRYPRKLSYLFYFLVYACFIASGKLPGLGGGMDSLSYARYAVYPVLFAAGLFVFKDALLYSWGLLRKHPVRHLLLLAGLYAAYILLSVLAYMAIGSPSGDGGINNDKVYEAMKTVPAYVTLTVLGVTGPVVEEFIYRHLLINRLSRRINVWICVLLSSLLFGLLHIHSLADLVNVVPYVVMGLVLGTLYSKSRFNLLLPILFHVFNNLNGLIPSLLY